MSVVYIVLQMVAGGTTARTGGKLELLHALD